MLRRLTLRFRLRLPGLLFRFRTLRSLRFGLLRCRLLCRLWARRSGSFQIGRRLGRSARAARNRRLMGRLRRCGGAGRSLGCRLAANPRSGLLLRFGGRRRAMIIGRLSDIIRCVVIGHHRITVRFGRFFTHGLQGPRPVIFLTFRHRFLAPNGFSSAVYRTNGNYLSVESINGFSTATLG